MLCLCELQNCAPKLCLRNIQVSKATAGAYSLVFASSGLASVTQIVQITTGAPGASISIGAPASVVLPSAAVVSLSNFTLSILDGGGNYLGASDSYIGRAVNRVLQARSQGCLY